MDYKILNNSTLHLVLRLRGNGQCDFGWAKQGKPHDDPLCCTEIVPILTLSCFPRLSPASCAGHPAPSVTVTCSDATPRVTSHFIVNLRGQGGFRARLDDFVQVWRQPAGSGAEGNTGADDGNTTAAEAESEQSESGSSVRVHGAFEMELNEERTVAVLRFFPTTALHAGDTVTVRLVRDAVNLGQWHSTQFPHFNPPATTAFVIPMPAAPTPVRLRVRFESTGTSARIVVARTSASPLEELRAALVAAGAPLPEGHTLTIACGPVQIVHDSDVLQLADEDTLSVDAKSSGPQAPGGK